MFFTSNIFAVQNINQAFIVLGIYNFGSDRQNCAHLKRSEALIIPKGEILTFVDNDNFFSSVQVTFGDTVKPHLVSQKTNQVFIVLGIYNFGSDRQNCAHLKRSEALIASVHH